MHFTANLFYEKERYLQYMYCRMKGKEVLYLENILVHFFKRSSSDIYVPFRNGTDVPFGKVHMYRLGRNIWIFSCIMYFEKEDAFIETALGNDDFVSC
jgi:hypothetical protein